MKKVDDLLLPPLDNHRSLDKRLGGEILPTLFCNWDHMTVSISHMCYGRCQTIPTVTCN